MDWKKNNIAEIVLKKIIDKELQERQWYGVSYIFSLFAVWLKSGECLEKVSKEV